jgi:uncharacterized repeat protein (TIGR03806 family)
MGRLSLFFVLAVSIQVFGQINRVPNTTLRFPAEPPVASTNFVLNELMPGVQFNKPVAVATPPGETKMLFVVERVGRILVIDDISNPNPRLFMDITGRVTASDWINNRRTEGLSSLAFHPNFKENGRFFITYNTMTATSQGTGHHNRLSEFRASSDHRTGLPDSEIPYITQFDEGDGHNINDIHFGTDGYLYVATGDEGDGGTGDDFNNAQKIDKDFFSAIMRIDVDKKPGNLPPNPHPANSNNYYVPADNPWVGVESFNGKPVDKLKIHDEFWAVGFRNPWRFSFDPLTGTIYEGDVGQHTREEINRVVRGGNYGWSFKEGTQNGPKGPVPAGVTVSDPLWEYGTGYGPDWGFSVTGGVVYRGSRFPALYGKLVYADYVSGNVWALNVDGDSRVIPLRLLGRTGIAGFGYDPRNGDVLAVDHDAGKIMVLQATDSSGGSYPATLSEAGIFKDLTSLQPNDGIYPYDVNVPFWSDGALKYRWFAIPDVNQKMDFSAEGNWTFPLGGIWIKHFELETRPGDHSSAKRVETRVLVRGKNSFYGLTYEWDDAGANATLVPENGDNKNFQITQGGITRTQVWRFPSRSECLSCHTPVSGNVLGFNTAQLNRSRLYQTFRTNQIGALAAANFFNNPPPDLLGLRSLMAETNSTVSRTYRVKSYLAANCVYCHQPGGSSLSAWDARLTTPLSLAKIINGALANTMGDPTNRVVVPGDPAHSALLKRIAVRGKDQMPPLASNVVDQKAIDLITAWIREDLPGYESYQQWADRHFAGQSGVDNSPEADPDEDGVTNYSEYLINADPMSRTNRFEVNMTLTNSNVSLSFTQPANRGILIDSTVDVTNPSWEFLKIPDNFISFPAAGTSRTVLDYLQSSQKFYRLRVIEP